MKIKHALMTAVLFAAYQTTSILGISPVDCMDAAAEVDPEITKGIVTRLCAGAQSLEPAKCYRDVPKVDSEINRGLAVRLCAGSTNAKKTIKCYEDAGAKGLNRGQAVRLCGARSSEE